MLLRIDHVGIACRSLEDAIERYVSVFGFAVVSEETNAEQGVREAMLATDSGETGVRLIDSRPRHGSMGASIAFLHPGDLGGVLTELVQPPGLHEM